MSAPSRARARDKFKHATPNPPELLGGSSQPNIKIFTFLFYHGFAYFTSFLSRKSRILSVLVFLQTTISFSPSMIYRSSPLDIARCGYIPPRENGSCGGSSG